MPWATEARRFTPLVLTFLAFVGLDVEGYVDHDRLIEGLSTLGVLGSVFTWLVSRHGP